MKGGNKFMTEDERKEYAYLVLKDLYVEFNHSVNHLNIKKGKETVYESSSIFKAEKQKNKNMI